ncbi:protein AF1q [Silurus asotus]|uniref:Protein AF1q n=1 Tax=Silurus asotus TaxID=30991 RepID=A0AAD5F9E1_SILAS|nr:protein AF1q [Silurus asotus]
METINNVKQNTGLAQSFCSSGVEVLEVKMLDVMSSQFDSFLFWRQPIATVDLSELEDLGLTEPKSKSRSLGKSSATLDHDEDLELSEFSTFNYWKEPIASIDMLDFNLLLL